MCFAQITHFCAFVYTICITIGLIYYQNNTWPMEIQMRVRPLAPINWHHLQANLLPGKQEKPRHKDYCVEASNGLHHWSHSIRWIVGHGRVQINPRLLVGSGGRKAKPRLFRKCEHDCHNVRTQRLNQGLFVSFHVFIIEMNLFCW